MKKTAEVLTEENLNELMQKISLFKGYNVNDLSTDLIEIVRISFSAEDNQSLHIALKHL